MSENSKSASLLDAHQVVYLPKYGRWTIVTLLAILALSSCVGAAVFLFSPSSKELVVPLLAIAQTAIGGLAVVMFVLLSEKQLSTDRLLKKTDEFLAFHVPDTLRRIEIPQITKDKTVEVRLIERSSQIHGHRKDIYGANYVISLGDFSMKLWVGINVKRLSLIYFVKVDGSSAVEKLKEDFQFTFGGAEKVGYATNFEYAEVESERLVSIWTNVFAENAILGNPAEQLFWVQDMAMMTQSVARTAARCGWNICSNADPAPL